MVVESNKTKAQASLLELLGGTQKKSDAKNTDTFSKLLASLGEGVKGDKIGIKTDTSKVFSAIIDPKKPQTDTSLQELLSGDKEKAFPKELLNILSNDQIHTLIYRAKEYLKNEITTKAPEVLADSKALPKTLLGLVQLADKMGLNPQSITLSTLVTEPAEQAKFSSALLTQPLLDTKLLRIPSTQTSSPSAFEAITQLLSESAAKGGASKSETAKKGSSNEQPLTALLQNLDRSSDVSPKSVEPKPAISSKTEGLISLLQGETKKEDEIKSSSGSKNEIDAPKIHSAPKADALEVKTKEAVQSMRFFATDLKEAVESYKPPFTRLTMTLNPDKLGEVEVTLVQRGNNVHVNIQSNNVNSVAFLAHNATELKAQLAGQGITNATMNFMSGGEGQPQNQGQQQQQQNHFRTYQSLEELKLNDEQISALEIIIPHYA